MRRGDVGVERVVAEGCSRSSDSSEGELPRVSTTAIFPRVATWLGAAPPMPVTWGHARMRFCWMRECEHTWAFDKTAGG